MVEERPQFSSALGVISMVTADPRDERAEQYALGLTAFQRYKSVTVSTPRSWCNMRVVFEYEIWVGPHRKAFTSVLGSSAEGQEFPLSKSSKMFEDFRVLGTAQLRFRDRFADRGSRALPIEVPHVDYLQ